MDDIIIISIIAGLCFGALALGAWITETDNYRVKVAVIYAITFVGGIVVGLFLAGVFLQ